MKKFTLAMVAAAALLFSGCYGSYTLTKKIYDWTGTLGDRHFVPAIVWIPVQWIGGIVCFVGDGLILNSIEFWTGSNPIAMQDGQVEKQVAEVDGQVVEMTASKGQLAIKSLTGEAKEAKLIFNEEEQAWYIQEDEGMRKFSQL